jgi:glyoxylase-like metal-dependent hydrolase (beta-lactamase superfamily II)
MATNVPEKWYEVRRFSEDISLITETWIADWLRCNIWHVKGKTHDLLIDTGMGVRPLKAEISKLSDRPIICVSSHCHFDHIGGAHEFDCRMGHSAEADIHNNPDGYNTGTAGFVRAETFRALPHDGFSFRDYRVKPAPLTGYLDEGDVVDLGNRHFNVLHLPGHSPGSIALWEKSTGILFSGDAIYDGDLYDSVYHSNREQFRGSLERLRDWPVETVHGGHGISFGRERMISIIDDYFAGKGVMGNVTEWIEGEIARSG